LKVPFVDLGIQYERIRTEVHLAWDEILSDTSFVLGPAVSAFETEFARYSGVDHCVAVGNGGDALELCLRALDVGFGDEVIIPANTFAATAMAVLQVGAIPVVVDVDEQSHLIDPWCIEEAITARTKAIVPVHLFGQLAPMARVLDVASRFGLWVIEDAAQCQGATQDGKHAGQFGDMAATSFYPGKNLGAFGDGGAVLTRHVALADRVRRLRNYGGVAKYEHVELGRNSRLDSIQAAVLRVKLRYLDAWNLERQRLAHAYLSALQSTGLKVPQVVPGNTHVWHLFVIALEERDLTLQHLKEMQIGAGIHYPEPVSVIPGVKATNKTDKASRLARKILSLPLFPGMTDSQQDYVLEHLDDAR